VITVTVKNAQGEPIAASNVELFSSRNEADMGVVDTLSAPSGTSTTEGVVTFHMTSTTTGSAVLTATADGMTLAQSATVTITPSLTIVAGKIGGAGWATT